MGHLCCLEPQIVRKARTKVKVTPTYHRLERLSKRMGSAITADLYNGLTTFKKKIKPAEIQQAWETGNYDAVMHTTPWEELPEHFEGFKANMDKTYLGSISMTTLALPAPVQLHLRFDIKNPRIRKYIDNHTGEMIENVFAEQQRVVQHAIHRSMTHAWKPKQVANYIKDSFGLDERRDRALANYRATLEADGSHSAEKIDKLVDGYADRLLNQRCMTIGRTETRFATKQGQLSVWRQAANQDLLNRATTKKVWIVDGNPCDICEPMDGVGVPLEEFWTLNNGDSVEVPTDSHPNCMCGMELDYGDQFEEASGDQDEEED
jgi:hypothetical protein